MPKRITHSDKQPELIAEPRAEYTITPQQQAEKDAYRERLRLHLKDPAFRQIEGFPIGEDEAILALSNPPYYTACPNPFLGEIIQKWQQERTALRQELGLPVDSSHHPQDREGKGEGYHREPFAADVSEGKNDPIYNAHSYHTKVPHKAIMRYILHYTDPGDIVLDGFCGTGMTGVAAQLCGDKATVESLGYHVDKKGIIYDLPPDKGGKPISRLWARKAALVDLSPAATFIAYNYNTPVDVRTFEQEAFNILSEVDKECGWMYETWHPKCDDQNRGKGKINFIIWSDVFICPQCGYEMVFWDVAIDTEKGQVRENWDCPCCQAHLGKTPKKDGAAQAIERSFETRFDRSLGHNVRQAKQVPVLINYSFGKKRHEKRPDVDDLALITRVEESDIQYPFPTEPMMFKGEHWGDTWRSGIHAGLTHVHHFYTRRNLQVLSAIWYRIRTKKHSPLCDFLFTSTLPWTTRQNRLLMTNYFHKAGGVIAPNLPGTLYISSVSVETNPLERFRLRVRSAPFTANGSGVAISCQSSTQLFDLATPIFDYIFVDPPFGGNLMYSELNFQVEAWLRLLTNNDSEAIVNKSQHKGASEYLMLMESAFREFYRLLKSGRWMTVEFHNSQSAIWNSIQQAILGAGFVVADVSILEKTHKTFKQVNTTNAVKKDLAISAYKPNAEFERRFLSEGGSIQGTWDFIRQHLEQLPIPALEDGVMETLAERQGYLLYDRMVAFHVQRGLSVPLSAAEFYSGLPQRFLDRDGMYFTPPQAAEYDKRRLGARKVEQLALFVSDEKSALLWLRRELDPETGGGPQTYQDLQPKFIRELHQARHEALPELRTILEQNFLQDPAERWYVPNPERQADLDGLRQKSLLREFGEYLQGKGRLKVFRSEAVRAGFSQAWKERNYDTILKVAERLPETVLQEDQNLLMYVHNAALRQQDQPRQMPLI